MMQVISQYSQKVNIKKGIAHNRVILELEQIPELATQFQDEDHRLMERLLWF